jgi:hypothetical protein
MSFPLLPPSSTKPLPSYRHALYQIFAVSLIWYIAANRLHFHSVMFVAQTLDFSNSTLKSQGHRESRSEFCSPATNEKEQVTCALLCMLIQAVGPQ